MLKLLKLMIAFRWKHWKQIRLKKRELGDAISGVFRTPPLPNEFVLLQTDSCGMVECTYYDKDNTMRFWWQDCYLPDSRVPMVGPIWLRTKVVLMQLFS